MLHSVMTGSKHTVLNLAKFRSLSYLLTSTSLPVNSQSGLQKPCNCYSIVKYIMKQMLTKIQVAEMKCRRTINKRRYQMLCIRTDSPNELLKERH